jgi:ketosteroid isomerase-like protein
MCTRRCARFMAVTAWFVWISAEAGSGDERLVVAKLDREFQAAVKINDAQTMQRILHKDMILVLGNGTTNTRDDLLREAREKRITYEQQDEDPGTQTVRQWGDTAVVTARLWVKGAIGGRAFNRRLWFSDTYVRTQDGWRYAFGQASLHLPGADDQQAGTKTASIVVGRLQPRYFDGKRIDDTSQLANYRATDGYRRNAP